MQFPVNRPLSALALIAGLSTLLAPLGAPVRAVDRTTAQDVAVRAHAADLSINLRLAAAQASYDCAAVNARVDRVWHAVPGLRGWSLDSAASMRATRIKDDGALHLVWRSVLPVQRLSSLPVEPIYKGPDAERSVAFMFNVSWGEEHVPKLLDTLREEHVAATFFLDGAWVRQHPELAREIARQGHVIGSHGSGHPDFRKLTGPQMQQQITTTNQVLERTLHRHVRLLAPPAGAFDERTVQAASRAGMYTILWSDDSVDWMRPSPDRIIQRVVAGIHPGALVLMHPTEPTVAALPRIIDRLRADGYAFKTVAEVVDEQPAQHPPTVLSGPE